MAHFKEIVIGIINMVEECDVTLVDRALPGKKPKPSTRIIPRFKIVTTSTRDGGIAGCSPKEVCTQELVVTTSPVARLPHVCPAARESESPTTRLECLALQRCGDGV